MPEGDTYAYAASRIHPVLVGQRIAAVEGSAPAVRRGSGFLVDRQVESVRTRGKHLLIDFSGGVTVHVHLGMGGRIVTTEPGRSPPGARGAVRLALTTGIGTAWVLGAPAIHLERRRVIEASLAHLGPDLLAPVFDVEGFRSRAARYPPSALLCAFLLDQRVMAGVGNVYKSEVLFLESLSPRREVGSVSLDGLERLATRARRLLRANSTRPVRSTTGRADGSSWVYDRTGHPCRRCRSAVEEGWMGDPTRITYWCPGCQR